MLLDGGKLVVGWNGSGGESGFYLFDLKMGECMDVLGFNNGVVFLLDGEKLFNILFIENGWMDIVEYNFVIVEMIMIVVYD